MKIQNNYYLITLALASLLPACAKHRASPAAPAAASSPNQAVSLVQVQKTSSFHQALTIVRSTSLRCENPADCPAQVALFLAADKPGGFEKSSDSVGACTAALVGEDLVLTNSHCLPSAVKLLPELCAERVRLIFPRTSGHPEETFACSQVLGFSEIPTDMSPDLALLRLAKKTTRPFLPVNRSGVAGDTPLKSYKVNPDLSTFSGILRAETCLSVANSYRMPIYRQASDPALVLGDCSAVPGNSGSPLLRQNGELVAVMQAELPISEKARREWGGVEGTEFAPLAMGTSLVCLAADLPDWQWNETCAPVSEEDVRLAPRPRIRQFLNAPALAQKIEELLAPFRSQNAQLRWERAELETKALRRQETFAPACGNTAEIELDIPRLSLEIKFNRYLQALEPTARITETERKSFRLQACEPATATSN